MARRAAFAAVSDGITCPSAEIAGAIGVSPWWMLRRVDNCPGTLGAARPSRYKPPRSLPGTAAEQSGCARSGERKDNQDRKRMMVTLPPDYRPSEDEEFMNPIQLEYFRQKLLRWRSELLREADGTLASLSEGGIHEADITDRASVETDRALELRTRDRARKLISKIDQALVRIELGTYGYCEETDEPIGIKRLEARPIATMSIEAQERHERMERVHRDD
jgi:DnaK suppressor protein